MGERSESNTSPLAVLVYLVLMSTGAALIASHRSVVVTIVVRSFVNGAAFGYQRSV